MSVIDTLVFQGDECLYRPAQMIYGIANFGNIDTIEFSSYHQSSLLVKCNEINLLFKNQGRIVLNFILLISIQKPKNFREIILDSRAFNNVVLTESDTGKVKKIYLSKYFGIIAIESNDTLFVK